MKLGWDEPHRKRRRGEPWEVYAQRLRAMAAAEGSRGAEEDALRRAAHYEETGGWRYEDEPEPIALPPLHLVTGWSKAQGRAEPETELTLPGSSAEDRPARRAC